MGLLLGAMPEPLFTTCPVDFGMAICSANRNHLVWTNVLNFDNLLEFVLGVGGEGIGIAEAGDVSRVGGGMVIWIGCTGGGIIVIVGGGWAENGWFGPGANR